MMKSIFKKLFIISLCFINIVSHAAVSVSDGSAFVTKAEFSADLNNLSTRMAQLENSLDATIDSLVSTYLKKNGIWNGKKQTLLINDIIDFWSNNALTTTAGAHWNWKSDFKLGTLTEGVEYKIRNQSFTFINNCDKSGMMIGKVDVVTGYDMAKRMVPTSSGTDGRNFSFFVSANGKQNPAVTSGSSLTFINGGLNVSKCVPVSLGINRMSAPECANASLWLMPATQTFNPVFFVNKGDSIIVNYSLSFAPQTNDAKLDWQNRTVSSVGSYPGVAMVFGDFYIY